MLMMLQCHNSVWLHYNSFVIILWYVTWTSRRRFYLPSPVDSLVHVLLFVALLAADRFFFEKALPINDLDILWMLLGFRNCSCTQIVCRLAFFTPKSNTFLIHAARLMSWNRRRRCLMCFFFYRTFTRLFCTDCIPRSRCDPERCFISP